MFECLCLFDSRPVKMSIKCLKYIAKNKKLQTSKKVDGRQHFVFQSKPVLFVSFLTQRERRKGLALKKSDKKCWSLTTNLNTTTKKQELFFLSWCWVSFKVYPHRLLRQLKLAWTQSPNFWMQITNWSLKQNVVSNWFLLDLTS